MFAAAAPCRAPCLKPPQLHGWLSELHLHVGRQNCMSMLQLNVGYGAAKEARPSDVEDGLSGAVC